MNKFQAVKDVVRGLADVRDGSFYRLWVDLTYLVKTPLPKIEFRLRRIADSKDAIAYVVVSLTRPDWIEVFWSLTVETTGEALIVTGSIELDTGEEAIEVYTNSQTLHDPADILDTIHTVADQVCSERSWLTRSWP